MVGPNRPQIAIFGSSIVKYSFADEGWAAIIAHSYARKMDVLLRGYAGWNSRQAVRILGNLFCQGDLFPPALVIVYFGGNDSMLPEPGSEDQGSHVPLPEYVENMRKIAIHIKTFAKKTHTRLIFLTTPPVNEEQLQALGIFNRTNEQCKKYADALIELCQELGIKGINLFNEFQERDNWAETSFTDGAHLAPAGSKIVAEEILKLIKEADWEPSLHFDDMPLEFEDLNAVGNVAII